MRPLAIWVACPNSGGGGIGACELRTGPSWTGDRGATVRPQPFPNALWRSAVGRVACPCAGSGSPEGKKPCGPSTDRFLMGDNAPERASHTLTDCVSPRCTTQPPMPLLAGASHIPLGPHVRVPTARTLCCVTRRTTPANPGLRMF